MIFRYDKKNKWATEYYNNLTISSNLCVKNFIKLNNLYKLYTEIRLLHYSSPNRVIDNTKEDSGRD